MARQREIALSGMTAPSHRQPASWMSHDSLIGYRAKLVEASIAKDSAFDVILEQTRTLITKICRLAIDDPISPRMNLVIHPDQIGDLM